MRIEITSMVLVATLWVGGAGHAARSAPGSELGQEVRPSDEGKDIEALVDVQQRMMKTLPALHGLRGQHFKHHGCVVATFSVDAGLTDELRYGLFRNPATYQAVVRFSNGGSIDDTKPDVHGMAVKLVGLKGERANADEHETQDFVLIDSRVFFMRNVKSNLEFAKALEEIKAQPPNFDRMKIFNKGHKEEGVLAADAVSRVISNPLRAQYWSTTPYKLGSGAVKYSARPRDLETPPPAAPGTTADYLRDAMVERLSSGKEPVVFDFYVIRQTDPASQPIEDPTVEWRTEPVKVATITIKPQGFSSAEQLEFCENLSYNPWHALSDHRPLGGINRARDPVYRMSTELRHATRKVARKEPTADDLSQFSRTAP